MLLLSLSDDLYILSCCTIDINLCSSQSSPSVRGTYHSPSTSTYFSVILLLLCTLGCTTNEYNDYTISIPQPSLHINTVCVLTVAVGIIGSFLVSSAFVCCVCVHDWSYIRATIMEDLKWMHALNGDRNFRIGG